MQKGELLVDRARMQWPYFLFHVLHNQVDNVIGMLWHDARSTYLAKCTSIEVLVRPIPSPLLCSLACNATKKFFSEDNLRSKSLSEDDFRNLFRPAR